MMGAMDARNMWSNLAVNKYLHTVASCWVSSTKNYEERNYEYKISRNSQRNFSCYLSSSSSSSSSSIGTTVHCGLWPVEQYLSIFSYRPPTLSIFSLPALEDLFLLPLSIFSWVFPFFSFLPVLE